MTSTATPVRARIWSTACWVLPMLRREAVAKTFIWDMPNCRSSHWKLWSTWQATATPCPVSSPWSM